jgi:hypothetical protein
MMFSSWSALATALQKQKPLHLAKRMERSRVAVSPFDGANRIRFKGSLSHCQFAIADCQLIHAGVSFTDAGRKTNRKLAI